MMLMEDSQRATHSMGAACATVLPPGRETLERMARTESLVRGMGGPWCGWGGRDGGGWRGWLGVGRDMRVVMCFRGVTRGGCGVLSGAGA